MTCNLGQKHAFHGILKFLKKINAKIKSVKRGCHWWHQNNKDFQLSMPCNTCTLGYQCHLAIKTILISILLQCMGKAVWLKLESVTYILGYTVHVSGRLHNGVSIWNEWLSLNSPKNKVNDKLLTIFYLSSSIIMRKSGVCQHPLVH